MPPDLCLHAESVRGELSWGMGSAGRVSPTCRMERLCSSALSYLHSLFADGHMHAQTRS